VADVSPVEDDGETDVVLFDQDVVPVERLPDVALDFEPVTEEPLLEDAEVPEEVLPLVMDPVWVERELEAVLELSGAAEDWDLPPVENTDADDEFVIGNGGELDVGNVEEVAPVDKGMDEDPVLPALDVDGPLGAVPVLLPGAVALEDEVEFVPVAEDPELVEAVDEVTPVMLEVDSPVVVAFDPVGDVPVVTDETGGGVALEKPKALVFVLGSDELEPESGAVPELDGENEPTELEEAPVGPPVLVELVKGNGAVPEDVVIELGGPVPVGELVPGIVGAVGPVAEPEDGPEPEVVGVGVVPDAPELVPGPVVRDEGPVPVIVVEFERG
jgi:hypothetical protein